MLEFVKYYSHTNAFGVANEGSPDSVKTMFACNNEGTVLITRRIIDNKMLRLVYNLDGTIGKLGEMVNKACALTNDDFKLYSGIQESAMNDSDEVSYDN